MSTAPPESLRSRRLGRAFVALALGASPTACLGELFAPETPPVVSGTITFDGAPLAGVELTLTGADTAVVTSAADGGYSIEIPRHGCSQVTPRLAGHAFERFAVSFRRSGTSYNGLNFTARPASTHAVSGTVSGSAGDGVAIARHVLRDQGWDPTVDGSVLAGPGGAFTIEGLPVGSYRIGAVAQACDGPGIAPGQVYVDGVVDFEHDLAGGLGDASLLGVLHGGNSVAAFFDVPTTAREGVGTLRPRVFSEIGPGDREAYEQMWAAAPTITVTYSTGSGNFAIELHLRADFTYSDSAVDFVLTERLTNATGINFIAVTPP